MLIVLILFSFLIGLIIIKTIISFINKNQNMYEIKTDKQRPYSLDNSVNNLEIKKRDNKKVLIVDDEQINLIILNEMLLKLNCSVKFAANGKECVDIFKEENGDFDIVFLDIVMPIMRGSEAFYLIKKINPNIKVIVATGFVPSTDEIQNMIKAGAIGVLQKPYSFIEISNFISQCKS